MLPKSLADPRLANVQLLLLAGLRAKHRLTHRQPTGGWVWTIGQPRPAGMPEDAVYVALPEKSRSAEQWVEDCKQILKELPYDDVPPA